LGARSRGQKLRISTRPTETLLYAAQQINFKLNGRANECGWLQASATITFFRHVSRLNKPRCR
jgi:hypothetical protein